MADDEWLSPGEMLKRRTEPIRVPLNVAQIVNDWHCLPTFTEAKLAIPWPGQGAETWESTRSPVTTAPSEVRIATAHGPTLTVIASGLSGAGASSTHDHRWCALQRPRGPAHYPSGTNESALAGNNRCSTR